MAIGFIHHFFPFDDTSLTDSITGQMIMGAVSPVVGAAPNSINFYAIDSDAYLSDAGWDAPDSDDVVIMVAGRAIDNSVHAGKESIGNISFYLGDSNSTHFRLQPYLSGIVDLITTTPYIPCVRRRAGVDYIFALCKRGTTLEHYAYNDLTDELVLSGYVDGTGAFPAVLANKVQFGHSSSKFPTGYITTTSNEPQDFYGALVAYFPDGAPSPSEILDAMNFHLNDAIGWKTSAKTVYPAWTIGEYQMADEKGSALASVTAADGAEKLVCVSGGATKTVAASVMRTYASAQWQGRIPNITSKGVCSCIIGDVQATNVTLLGSANVFHFIPFIMTKEQATAGFSYLVYKFLGNTVSTVNRMRIAVYDADTDILLGATTATVNPNANSWVSNVLPTITSWPQRVLIGICPGVNGGAGADCSVAIGLLLSRIGWPSVGGAAIGTGKSAAAGYIISSAWDTEPSDSTGLTGDATSLSDIPFALLEI